MDMASCGEYEKHNQQHQCLSNINRSLFKQVHKRSTRNDINQACYLLLPQKSVASRSLPLHLARKPELEPLREVLLSRFSLPDQTAIYRSAVLIIAILITFHIGGRI
ncbi:uncharacterized protein APUU_80881A [Aspergillus puulaauensis]|uniref:Uncharacterized protein n=1 Tax=Aspergillus puulaauensis TaxID=1220207 RepID=A0A7R8AV66_9EURO|nr:uncharacterized protein APUU_80881A [Aspergillus puulaauensis]BCS30578.1 hypothetical protein APUU_80881A [Aspergillus puulaauensis]